MARTTGNRYVPNYLVTPGAVLQDYLESLGMTQAELAERTGLTKKTINEIAKGKAPITPETAMRFERPLGRPAHFWNNLELQYQEDIVRLEEEKRRQANLDWLADKDNPIGEVSLPRVCVMNNLSDMRAAIDEAMRLDPEVWRAVEASET